MPVQVIIKSAAQTVDDFTLDCEMSWTIAQVKDQISTLYPTKPKREHQKLIYGGKLLPDHLTLQSVLNKMQDIHILHIVCPLSYIPTPQKSSVSPKVPASPLCTASPPSNPSGIYPQANPQILTPGLASGIPGIMNGVPYASPDVAQQYLAMQQMYTQLMTQYFAQYNGTMPYTPLPPTPAPVQQPQNTPPRPNPVQQRERQQMEEEARDYIDYLYMFSRAALFVAMLLFYSSFSRVMAVCGMVFLLTLFAKINRHNQQQEMQARERQNAEAAAATERAAAEDVSTTGNEQTPETGSESPSPPETVPPTTSVPSTIFTLVTAFFSSLIPTDPLPVQVN